MSDWSLLLKFDKSGLATNENSADIPDNMLQTAAHCIFDKKVLEVAPGRTRKYTAMESGAAVDGIHRAWDKAGNKKTLVACNGKIKYDNGSAWADLQTGLTAGVDYDFKNWKDRTFIINGKDEAREFYPRSNLIQKAGLEPPRFYKKVAYFESDETINLGSGIEADNIIYRPTERTGSSSRSLKLTATAGNSTSAYVTFSPAQDFSKFTNGSTVTKDDFVCISIFHRIRDYIAGITLRFYTSDNNYFQTTIDATDLDPILLRNNQWTDLKIRRSRFEEAGAVTGTPSWSNITRFYCILTAVTGAAVINVDNVYLKNSPIKATSYARTIDSFEKGTDGWTQDGQASKFVSNTQKKYVKQGDMSMMVGITGSKTVVLTKNIDVNLAQHVDGVASPTSDEIAYWVYCTNENLTSIKIEFTTTGDDPYFTWPAGNNGLQKTRKGVWSDARAKKSDFTGDSPDWSTVSKVTITIITSGTCELYFDDLRMTEASYEKPILTMERTAASEAWVWDDGKFYFNEKNKVEGDTSVYLKCAAKKVHFATGTVSMDLSIFGAGETSTEDDLICFWMMWDRFKTIQKVEIQIDIDDGSFTDYMKYEITPEMLMSFLSLTGENVDKMNNKSLTMQIRKDDFSRVGDTDDVGWKAISKVRFYLYGASKGSAVTVYFDNLTMRRRTGLTGLYQFACCFVNSNNEPSALSEWSEMVELTGSRAVLSLIPVSQDANCIARWIFRRGGSLGQDARLDEIIWDNTTTVYYTGIEDYETGILASDLSIPQGTIRFPSISKFGPVYKDRLTGFGDTEHPEYLYFSNTGFWYAWSELQAWKFDSKVLDVWVDDDVLFVNTNLGIRRIRVDLGEITADDIEEIGIVKHSMGAWASCKVEEARAFVSYDGVYLMNGSQLEGPISSLIEDKFTGTTYTLSSCKAIYRNKHLYISMVASSVRSLLDCYIPNLQWRTSDYPIRCFCLFDGPGDKNELYGGTTGGEVYQLDTGYASGFSVVTKDYAVSDNPFDEVALDEIWIKARSNDNDSGSINVQFRTDQSLVSDITFSLPKNGNLTNNYASYFRRLREYQNYLKGSKIGLSITPETAGKHVAIESILLKGTLTHMPKELEE